MIKIEKAQVYGFEPAIRGMRNPYNSWDKSDSKGDTVGENDLALMKKLVKAGTDHSKFMRFIIVTCDITAPIYYWKEFDTYKVGTVRNSCSTMHTIMNKKFELNDFSCKNMPIIVEATIRNIITSLNSYRNLYLKTQDKLFWDQVIMLLPESYNQKSTVQMNYTVLRNMYYARKNHKLEEWKDFCKWVESLPYSELITMD